MVFIVISYAFIAETTNIKQHLHFINIGNE